MILGRYEVLHHLGTGGTGSVYAAHDLVTDRQVALKRLLPGATSTVTKLFEREYQTLKGLKHPRIVEVFDYGSDELGAFYTMELLQGEDLSGKAPMDWREVCSILRDSASILGLLHARRLVHRDLSPRNLWRTRDGRIKLLDFGALASFGPANELCGTPPFVPPEALHGQVLDQRSDLYALGALAYWLLTGTYAFPAKTFAELPRYWQHEPPALATLAQVTNNPALGEVPAELNELVRALLHMDPKLRPESAAELIDRINAIACFAPETDSVAVQAYLSSKAFVGRERERDVFLRLLGEVRDGAVRALFVEGAPGVGRSRLLDELALIARVTGTTTVSVRATNAESPYALACAIAEGLIDAGRDDALAYAAPRAAVLGHLSPTLRERLGSAALARLPDEASEQRYLLQNTLREWLRALSEARPLVLLIDDLHLADEPSQALLAVLAHGETGQLLLAASAPQELHSSSSKALLGLRKAATHLHLAPLGAAQVRELLRSVFGDANYLERLAERLLRLSGGNPAHCLELSQHLVDCGAATYADGVWQLPRELSGVQFPNSRDEMALQRLERLSAEERSLARELTVLRHGELTSALCHALSSQGQETGKQLAALCQAAVLVETPEGYRFERDALRSVLHDELPVAARSRAHRRAGAAILQSQGEDPPWLDLRAALHLLHAGDMKQGEILLARAGRHFSEKGFDALHIVAPLFEECLDLLKAQGKRRESLIFPLMILAFAGYYVDRRYATRYGDEAMQLLERALHLQRARWLRRFLGPRLSVIISLLFAALPLYLRRATGPTLPEAVALLVTAASTLCGVTATCLDHEGGLRFARVIEPLGWLGERTAPRFAHRFVEALAGRSIDDIDRPHKCMRQLLDELEGGAAIRGLSPYVRGRYAAGLRVPIGVAESWREPRRALAIADEMDALGPFSALHADHLRASCHANLGNLAESRRYRQRVELHAIQLGSAWQAESWASADNLKTSLLTLDALATKHAAQDLARLSEEMPTFRHHARCAEAAYLILRGKHAEAVSLLDYELGRPIIGWGRQRGVLARALNAMGDHERAREVCLRALAQQPPEDLDYPLMNVILPIELALAEAALGDFQAARTRLEEQIARHAENKGPLIAGCLFEARASVALLESDIEGAKRFLRAMEESYRPTGISSLISRVENMHRNLARACNPEAKDADPLLQVDASQLAMRVQLILHHSGTLIEERGRRGIQVAMELTRADSGFLIVRGADTPIASLGANEPGHALIKWAADRLAAAFSNDETAANEDVDGLIDLNLYVDGGLRYCVAPMWATRDRDHVVVGAMALGFRHGAPCLPSADVMHVIANHLAGVSNQNGDNVLELPQEADRNH